MAKKPKSLKDLKKTNQEKAKSKAGPVSKHENIHAAIGDAKTNQIKALLIGGFVAVTFLIALGIFYVFSKGMVVQIKPDDAVNSGYVTLDSGIGWVSDEQEVFVFGSTYQISAHAKDFISQSILITPDQKTSFLTVTLKPKPATVKLTTEPAQNDTKWLIDSEQVSTRAVFNTELDPGNYQLDIDNPYFEPYSERLTLQRAEEVDRTITLNRVQGKISLKATPTGASAILDGETTVVLPYSGLLGGGKHTIQILAAGYTPIADQIEITNKDRLVERDYRMQPLQSTVRINVQPKSSRLTLDGRSVNNADITPVNANQNYNIVASKLGYISERRTIRAAPGQTQDISITLKPAFGAVSLISEPRGADVYIGGQHKGKAPLTLNMQVLPTRVEFRRPGYRNVIENIIPVLNKPTNVQARLVTELEARLRELPKIMQDSAGLELVRFKPDQQAFFIGAARGETGQRANEILRQMQLTKHFYASKYEVTVGQFKKFQPSYTSANSHNMPATGITWQQAAEFCNWLSGQEQLNLFYIIRSGQVVGFDPYADGYRLPSESEWEWLARKSNRPRLTPFTWGTKTAITTTAGNIADETAKGSVPKFIPKYTDRYGNLAPVGSFPAETSGLHDMSGNVREWVNDRYALNVPAKGSVAVNDFGPTTGEGHVVKGSSFKTANLTYLRAASRRKETVMADDIGFRVVRYVYGAEDK